MRLGKWLMGSVICVGLGAALAAQGTRTQEPDVLAALLVEVRGLRQAMEQMAQVGPRVQLALGRLQLQEQRINASLRRQDGLRDAVASVERGLAQGQREIEERERQLKDPETQSHPEREAIVKMLTEQLTGLKRRLAVDALEVQRLQAEQATLEQQIATEQGRWNEMNRAMEDLERALGRPAGK